MESENTLFLFKSFIPRKKNLTKRTRFVLKYQHEIKMESEDGVTFVKECQLFSDDVVVKFDTIKNTQTDMLVDIIYDFKEDKDNIKIIVRHLGEVRMEVLLPMKSDNFEEEKMMRMYVYNENVDNIMISHSHLIRKIALEASFEMFEESDDWAYRYKHSFHYKIWNSQMVYFSDQIGKSTESDSQFAWVDYLSWSSFKKVAQNELKDPLENNFLGDDSREITEWNNWYFSTCFDGFEKLLKSIAVDEQTNSPSSKRKLEYLIGRCTTMLEWYYYNIFLIMKAAVESENKEGSIEIHDLDLLFRKIFEDFSRAINEGVTAFDLFTKTDRFSVIKDMNSLGESLKDEVYQNLFVNYEDSIIKRNTEKLKSISMTEAQMQEIQNGKLYWRKLDQISNPIEDFLDSISKTNRLRIIDTTGTSIASRSHKSQGCFCLKKKKTYMLIRSHLDVQNAKNIVHLELWHKDTPTDIRRFSIDGVFLMSSLSFSKESYHFFIETDEKIVVSFYIRMARELRRALCGQ